MGDKASDWVIVFRWNGRRGTEEVGERKRETEDRMK